jgi:uncharacterized protein YbjQ (UPF0145 family)
MLLTTQDNLEGYEVVETFGIVQGNTVRARHVGRDFMAGLKNIVGGEISEYSELLIESRKEAINRMVAQARSLGADAIVAVRFETSDIMQGAAELFVYGTAVKVKRS